MTDNNQSKPMFTDPNQYELILTNINWSKPILTHPNWYFNWFYILIGKLGIIEKRYVSIPWGLKASAHYVLRYLASVIVDGIWLVSVMVDGKYKYLKMSALQ